MSRIQSLSGRSGTRRSDRIRTLGRWAVVPFVVAVFAINAIGGSTRGSIARAPATDDEIAAFVADQARDSGIPGAAVAIVRNGQVSTARGFGVADGSGRAVTGTTPFVIGSVSKPITATAVLQLVEAGRVNLDTPVRTYLPDFALADSAAAAAITIRQLLDQTSGLPTSAGQRPLNGPVTDLAAQVAALADVRPATRPGAAYAYSNANYVVLGRLVEQVSGEPYDRYIDEHIFAALDMDHAHADRSAAVADGLTQAHRLWFGLARTVSPLDRPDLVSAGFLTASAADLGRFVAAQVNGGTVDGHRVLSAASVAEMQQGVVAMGPGDPGRYGLGWADGEIGGIRMVGHVGSTTDMASVALFSPEQRSGVVILLNGQSTIYELIHKPDLIGVAAFEMLLGRQPDGTIALFYPAFNILVGVVLGFIAWRLVRTVRRLRRGEDITPRLLGRRWLGIAVAVWLNAIIPAELLLAGPAFLGAPWSTLIQVDLGLVLFVFAILRLMTGVVLAAALVRWTVRRRSVAE